MRSFKHPLSVTVVLLGVALAGCGGPRAPIGACVRAARRCEHDLAGSHHPERARRAADRSSDGVRARCADGRADGQDDRCDGVKHTRTTPAPKPADSSIIPYSAVIYDPSGKTYAFTNTAPLTYIEVPITVDQISGNSVYLQGGPKAGQKVVSVGAEELYGVQTGVLAQT